ncbi:MAG TPA: DUF4328 domain-containing protein [Pseudonocardiaceae bacterium]|jgi:hypothetical protein
MAYPNQPQRQQSGYSNAQWFTWVATPPPGVSNAPRPRPRPAPYEGPPAYPAAPRWGLPRLAWRASNSVPGTVRRPEASPVGLIRQAALTGILLWVLGAGALVAAGGEIWRYTLLVLGRDEALSASVVSVSDTIVLISALFAAVLGFVVLVLTVRWLLQAGELAAKVSGYTRARPTWQLLLGVLLPVLNLFVAGSVLAELEHAALGAPATARPRPSRLVLAWWAAWGVGEVIAISTLLLGLRTSLQARADGVLWHAATDLVAVVVAVLTIKVLRMITGLLAPTGVPAIGVGQVIAVRDAPAPELRPARPVGSAR